MNRSGHPSQRGTSSKATDNDTAAGSTPESVGSLLAAIANSINDALRLLMFADKAHWGPDEFEQVRALEATLDEAKKDFQEMGPLLKGSVYYENDRRSMYLFSPWSHTSSLSVYFMSSPHTRTEMEGPCCRDLGRDAATCRRTPKRTNPLVLCDIPICIRLSIRHVTPDIARPQFR